MPRGRPPYPDVLTPREQEVLELIREGLTNEQIAARLGISESGARYHVSEILTKLSVSSRVEAALWQQQGRRRLPALALAARLADGAAAATARARVALIALAGFGLLALALGVAVMSTRGGAGVPAQSDEEVSIIAELPDLLRLAEEAAAEAHKILPDAHLYLMAYATPSGLYTFRFSVENTPNDVTILGPYIGDPAFPRWEIIEEVRPSRLSVLSPLDIGELENLPIDVAEAASLHAPISPANAGVMLWSENGVLRWNVNGGRNIWLNCAVPDADLSQVTCDMVEGASANEFATLAAEALGNAENRTGDELMLFQLHYDSSTGLYAFHLTELAPAHETVVIGPHAEPGRERWEVTTTQSANLRGAAYRPLDFTQLRLSPVEVATAIEAVTPGLSVDVMADQAFGSHLWVTFAQTDEGVVRCEVLDTADLSDPASIRCTEPLPAPPTATP